MGFGQNRPVWSPTSLTINVTSYDASPIKKNHPKCKINSAFKRKKIAKLYYGLNLTTGGLF